jgi:hypothetical protein
MSTSLQRMHEATVFFALFCVWYSILGPPDERTWPGVSKLPYYPHFLPKFIGKPMSKLIPLNDTVADRELIWDVLSACVGCVCVC